MFQVRTTAPVEGQQPYKWGVESQGQCTWGVYYRCIEAGFSPCCWWDRATKTGSYTNAKLWPQNFRDPWQVKGTDYEPMAGDVAVFDGEYGHVAFIERVNGKTCLISDWNRVAPLTYASDNWQWGTQLKGCGPLMCYLHFPYESVEPVGRNENVNQIQTTDEQLRIRNAPSLSGEIVGHVQLGYYNVISQTEGDGYTWYQIATNRWCANITTNYLPAESSDIVKEIKKYFDMMEMKVQTLSDETATLKSKLDKIQKEAQY